MIGELTREPEFLSETKYAATPSSSTPIAVETLSDRPEENLYPLPFLKLYIKSNENDWIEPDWLFSTLDALQKLYDLSPNWDSYDALKIDTRSLESTLRFLLEFLPSNAPLPAIIPTPNGNVQIEWHEGGIDLEIEIRTHGVHDYYFCDIQKNIEVEKVFTGNVAPLREYIETLAQRS